jgi:hypothetical protein
MTQLFYDFFYFIKKPSTFVNKPFEKISLKNFAIIFVVVFCFENILQNLVALLSTIDTQPPGYAMSNDYFWTFWNSVLVAPFLEELEFRFPLKNRKWIHNVLLFIFFTNALFTQNLFIILISMFGFGLYTYIKKTNDSINNSLVWLSATVFGLAHLFVINDNYWHIINIIPFVVFGLIASYLRIKFGFWYGFLYHAGNNLFAFVIKSFLQEVVKNTDSFNALILFIQNSYLTAYDPLLTSFLAFSNFISAFSFSLVLYMLIFKLSFFGNSNKPFKYIAAILIIGIVTLLYGYTISEDKRQYQIMELENYSARLKEEK